MKNLVKQIAVLWGRIVLSSFILGLILIAIYEIAK